MELGGAAQPSKSPAPKKNTVDYIASKISYDTAIPVSVLEDRSDFIEKCKPYDIIDGPNPLDDVDAPEPGRLTTSSAIAAEKESVKAERGSARGARKRSRTPSKLSKLHAVKSEANTDDDNDREAEEALAAFTRPCRPGWSAERLAETRPYQLLRSHDMETRVRYVLDDVDYEWCDAHDVAAESLQRGMTYLEWAYVSSLLRAATPHLAPTPSRSGTDADAAGAPFGSSKSGASPNGNGGGAAASSDAAGATGGTGTGNGTANVRRPATRRHSGSDKSGAPGAEAAACVCGLCSKPVQLLGEATATNAAEHQHQRHHQEGAAAPGAAARRNGGGNGSGCRSHTTSSAASNGKLRSAARPTAFPSHDAQQRGLRCGDCGVTAHLRCWFLSEPPRQPELWVCDGCTNYAQHRKRSAGVCCMCGRPGGVLLPYVSSNLRDDADTPAEPQPAPLSASVAAELSGTFCVVALSDMVCHAVCALSMPELAIHQQETVLRRNGLVDMHQRPYVYALRRVEKHKYAMNCEFCQHGTGRCVQCSHPHCFEAMHASCSADAHTVDCHTASPFSPTASSPGGNGTAWAASPTSTLATPGSVSVDAGGRSFTPTAPPSTSGGWASCSPYCRKHYGYTVSKSVGSAALGDKAEAEALSLDLTGILTGGDGVTSPLVRKRGRGRPPVALVQQREAERALIGQLRAYWVERREQRRQVSAQLVSEINARLRPIVEASLRLEIVKISSAKVRLSHFLSLVPEWQWRLVAVVEGELPLPDEEYDDVQKYRKVAHTRRSGNTRSLYDKMSVAAKQLDVLCRVAEAMKEQCRLRRSSVEQELSTLRLLSGWDTK